LKGESEGVCFYNTIITASKQASRNQDVLRRLQTPPESVCTYERSLNSSSSNPDGNERERERERESPLRIDFGNSPRRNSTQEDLLCGFKSTLQVNPPPPPESSPFNGLL
jgi:hypothetical protein